MRGYDGASLASCGVAAAVATDAAKAAAGSGTATNYGIAKIPTARSAVDVVINAVSAGCVAVGVGLLVALGIDAIAMFGAARRHGESDSGEKSELDFARLAHGFEW